MHNPLQRLRLSSGLSRPAGSSQEQEERQETLRDRKSRTRREPNRETRRERQSGGRGGGGGGGRGRLGLSAWMLTLVLLQAQIENITGRYEKIAQESNARMSQLSQVPPAVRPYDSQSSPPDDKIGLIPATFHSSLRHSLTPSPPLSSLPTSPLFLSSPPHARSPHRPSPRPESANTASSESEGFKVLHLRSPDGSPDAKGDDDCPPAEGDRAARMGAEGLDKHPETQREDYGTRGPPPPLPAPPPPPLPILLHLLPPSPPPSFTSFTSFSSSSSPAGLADGGRSSETSSFDGWHGEGRGCARKQSGGAGDQDVGDEGEAEERGEGEELSMQTAAGDEAEARKSVSGGIRQGTRLFLLVLVPVLLHHLSLFAPGSLMYLQGSSFSANDRSITVEVRHD
eukprot:574452-Hanusia_phi.AAC.1